MSKIDLGRKRQKPPDLKSFPECHPIFFTAGVILEKSIFLTWIAKFIFLMSDFHFLYFSTFGTFRKTFRFLRFVTFWHGDRFTFLKFFLYPRTFFWNFFFFSWWPLKDFFWNFYDRLFIINVTKFSSHIDIKIDQKSCPKSVPKNCQKSTPKFDAENGKIWLPKIEKINYRITHFNKIDYPNCLNPKLTLPDTQNPKIDPPRIPKTPIFKIWRYPPPP